MFGFEGNGWSLNIALHYNEYCYIDHACLLLETDYGQGGQHNGMLHLDIVVMN